MTEKVYDVVIIGAGPAGLTGAVYALRSGRSVLVIEKMLIGGQIALTQYVENYPGFEKISGFELGQFMHEQAVKLGAETKYGEVVSVDFNNDIKKIVTTDGEVFGKSVIIASGAKARKLGLENEEKLIGGGVAYCAVCDGAFFRDKNVVLVGGGNTAVEDAIYLSKMVKTLTIVNMESDFTAQKILVEELNAASLEKNNVKVLNNSVVTAINGDQVLNSVDIKNLKTNEVKNVEAQGLFVAIGRVPDTEFLKGIIELDKWNYIVTNEELETGVAGVYAAGDVRVKRLRQIVTATSDGAIAATNANEFLNRK